MKISPNFYMSEPYLELSGAVCFSDWGRLSIEADDVVLFPPVRYGEVDLRNEPFIWSDFGEAVDIHNHNISFLDYQYIFDPKAFNNLEGGKWSVFRKNIRKWPRENPSHEYSSNPPTNRNKSVIEDLMMEWCIIHKDDAEDARLVMDFVWLSRNPKIKRHFLYRNGELVGVNAFDENWKYINYRVCIVKATDAHLSEYMRYLFYTSDYVQNSGKLVNDGGCLGRKSLEIFKDKLHPLHKQKIYSLKLKTK
jgi:hypothetical protein